MERIIHKKNEWVSTGQRVLITGGTGLVGNGIIKAALGNDDIISFSRGENKNVLYKQGGLEIVRGDVLIRDEVRQTLISKKPDVVIHTVGAANVDVCQKDPQLAHDLNITATEIVAEECLSMGIPFVYISTDYVFPRHGGPFSINDKPATLLDKNGKNPNIYGLTKRLGEIAALERLESSRKVVVVRISSPYDKLYTTKPGTPPLLMQRIIDSLPVKMVNDSKTTYTHVEDIAHGLNKIINGRLWEEQQIFHIGGPEYLSAAGIVYMLLDKFPETKSQIKEVTSDEYFEGEAPRPIDGGLRDSIVEGRTLEEGLF